MVGYFRVKYNKFIAFVNIGTKILVSKKGVILLSPEKDRGFLPLTKGFFCLGLNYNTKDVIINNS